MRGDAQETIARALCRLHSSIDRDPHKESGGSFTP